MKSRSAIITAFVAFTCAVAVFLFFRVAVSGGVLSYFSMFFGKWVVPPLVLLAFGSAGCREIKKSKSETVRRFTTWLTVVQCSLLIACCIVKFHAPRQYIALSLSIILTVLAWNPSAVKKRLAISKNEQLTQLNTSPRMNLGGDA